MLRAKPGNDAVWPPIRRWSNPNSWLTGPSQVWTWDITKIRGPAKGIWYHLYALIDIYSRYKPGWIWSAPAEDSVLAATSSTRPSPQKRADPAHGARRPGHLDDLPTGLGALTKLGVTRTHSRPADIE